MLMKKGSSVKSKERMDTSKKKSPEDYLKEPYARILIPEEDWTFSAEILEFPGCFSQGSDPNEAFKNLEEAAKSWIAVALDQGQEIPPPSANHGYSGKIALRLPRDLHRLAVRKAERDGVSLNQCLVSAIAAWLGAEGLYNRLVEKIQRPSVQLFQANFMIPSTANPKLVDLGFGGQGSIAKSAVADTFPGTLLQLPRMRQQQAQPEARHGRS